MCLIILEFSNLKGRRGDKMKKRVFSLYFLIVVALIITGCSTDSTDPDNTGAAGNTWRRTYGSQANNSCFHMIPSGDGGYLLVGITNYVEVPEMNGDVYLMKVDGEGNIIWEKSYGGPRYDVGLYIHRNNDNTLLIAGQTLSAGASGTDLYLVKTDAQGERIWSKTIGGPLIETMGHIHPASDGGYILIGNIVDPDDIIADAGAEGYGGFDGRSNVHMIKVDPAGNPEWSKTFASEKNTLTTCSIQTEDGGYLIAANILYFPVNDNDFLLIKVDGNGNEQWTRTWEGEKPSMAAMVKTADNNYLISGRIAPLSSNSLECNFYFLKVRPDGSEIWNRQFGIINRFETAALLLETPGGDLVGVGGSQDIIIIRLNSQGNELWTNTVSTGTHNTFSGIAQAEDGGFVIACSQWSNGPRILLVKTDPQGQVN